MKSSVGRIYAMGLAIIVFFVSWALIATRPWAPTAKEDPRLVALERREKRLRAREAQVMKLVERRWNAYYRKLAKVDPQLAAVGRRRLKKALRTGTMPSVVVLAVLPAAPPRHGGVPAAGGSSAGGLGDVVQVSSGGGVSPSGSGSVGSGGASGGSGGASTPAQAAPPEPAPQPAEAAPPPAEASAPVTESGSS